MNLYVILGAGIVVAAMTGGAYFKGKAADRERSDAVILKMHSDAARDLGAANTANAAATTKLQATKSTDCLPVHCGSQPNGDAGPFASACLPERSPDTSPIAQHAPGPDGSAAVDPRPVHQALREGR